MEFPISKNDHIGQILEFPLEKTHISSYLKYGLSILPGWPFWPMFTWQKEEHLLDEDIVYRGRVFFQC